MSDAEDSGVEHPPKRKKTKTVDVNVAAAWMTENGWRLLDSERNLVPQKSDFSRLSAAAQESLHTVGRYRNIHSKHHLGNLSVSSPLF